MKDEIGVFCRCVLLYTKPPGKTSAPPLDVPLCAGEVHDIVKSICRISCKNLASGQTQQNFSFIQAAKGKRSGEGVPKSVGQCRIRAEIWPHDPQTANRHRCGNRVPLPGS